MVSLPGLPENLPHRPSSNKKTDKKRRRICAHVFFVAHTLLLRSSDGPPIASLRHPKKGINYTQDSFSRRCELNAAKRQPAFSENFETNMCACAVERQRILAERLFGIYKCQGSLACRKSAAQAMVSHRRQPRHKTKAQKTAQVITRTGGNPRLGKSRGRCWVPSNEVEPRLKSRWPVGNG